nr:MAG TPA: hypothetical protein [Caudoviricetes sp.]
MVMLQNLLDILLPMDSRRPIQVVIKMLKFLAIQTRCLYTKVIQIIIVLIIAIQVLY